MTTFPVPNPASLNKFVLSITTNHAGEENQEILRRKINDVTNTGRTFWYYTSANARPDVIQAFVNDILTKNNEPWCVFVAPSNDPPVKAKTHPAASEFSLAMPSNTTIWQPLPLGISPVTGKMDLASHPACALVLDRLGLVPNAQVNLLEFVQPMRARLPLRFDESSATLCAERTLPPHARSLMREIRLIGRLVHPFAVWLR